MTDRTVPRAEKSSKRGEERRLPQNLNLSRYMYTSQVRPFALERSKVGRVVSTPHAVPSATGQMVKVSARWLGLKDVSLYVRVGQKRLKDLARDQHCVVRGWPDPDSGRGDWVFDLLSLDACRERQRGYDQIKAASRTSYSGRRWRRVHVASSFPLAGHYRAMLGTG